MSKWGMNTLSLYVQRNEEVISADSRSLISKRYCTVTSAMNREFWNITSDRQNSIYVGSYGRGTAIDTSDIDILMSLPESYYNQFNSVYGNGQSRLLQVVRQAILVRYPRSEVRADGQVVKINFSDGMFFEILPAFKNWDGSYRYPDTNMGGNWRSTNPKAEQDAMKNKNISSNGLLFDTCKHLRYVRDNYFRSYHLSGIVIDSFVYYNKEKEAEKMATELFKNIPSKVGDLVRDVRIGKIGLPDLQRPFVWKDNKIRELYDSMLKGYPIGYIMLWESPADYDEKKSGIGINGKIYTEPKELVIDGQQRLTALVASMYGVKVKDKNFVEREIKISFNPLTREFAVWTSAFERTPEWIPKVSDVFLAKENNTISAFRRKYIRAVNEARNKREEKALTDAEEDLIENNINDLLNLSEYSLPTLEISYNAREEDVADIFVRVNSGGQSLTENNFIQTLISVYENETSDQMNLFCEQSRIPASGTSYNNIIAIEPSHLIRMAVGVGFRRARLRYAYMLLRGKNLETGKYSAEERQENLAKFKEALLKVMDLNNWHAFLNCIGEAGYISKTQIASSNAVVFSYVLYLIAKYDYKLDAVRLKKTIAKWFFMGAITYFYTGSTESEVEKQFADLRNVHDAEQFIAYIERTITTRFTEDYFRLTLPNELNSAAAISPAWNGYIAAQVVLNTPMLFSATPVSKYFILGASGTKNAVDKHHIFPKNYLTQIGYMTDRERNQIANFTYLDYVTNIDISDDPPVEYVERYRNRMGETEYHKTCEDHALPPDFEKMEYIEFLKERRLRMAQIVQKAYKKLCE